MTWETTGNHTVSPNKDQLFILVLGPNWVPGTYRLDRSCAAHGFDEAVVLSNEFRTQNFLVNLKVIDVAILKVAVCQNLVPLVNIKIAGKWMFIPPKSDL